MKILFLLLSLCFVFTSCKKNYVCECNSNRRGFVFNEFTKNYKERNKTEALSKCKNEYGNSSNYSEYSICEIK